VKMTLADKNRNLTNVPEECTSVLSQVTLAGNQTCLHWKREEQFYGSVSQINDHVSVSKGSQIAWTYPTLPHLPMGLAHLSHELPLGALGQWKNRALHPPS